NTGQKFSIDVDTTPTIPRRPDLPPPVFPGRDLTLQQRVNGDQWQTIETAVTDNSGKATFHPTAGNTSPAVYRVRQEDWFKNGSRIGWFPSFPTYLPGNRGTGGGGITPHRTNTGSR